MGTSIEDFCFGYRIERARYVSNSSRASRQSVNWQIEAGIGCICILGWGIVKTYCGHGRV